MTKEIWINLPVKDLKASKEFFTQIGFKLNTANIHNEQEVANAV